MIRFLVRRLLSGALVVWLVATVVFVMYFAAPRDVARLIAGRQATRRRSRWCGTASASTSPC